tara:strand:+ start:193 stop:372 length:180 start_codon:yes stop_codon:yes gene_type:complete
MDIKQMLSALKAGDDGWYISHQDKNMVVLSNHKGDKKQFTKVRSKNETNNKETDAETSS